MIGTAQPQLLLLFDDGQWCLATATAAVGAGQSLLQLLLVGFKFLLLLAIKFFKHLSTPLTQNVQSMLDVFGGFKA